MPRRDHKDICRLSVILESADFWPCRCRTSWHPAQSVIGLSSELSPPRLRNSSWWTSRFDLLPQLCHLHPSRRRRTCPRNCSYNSGSSRRRGRLGRIQLMRLAESMPTSLPYIVFDCPFWKQLAYLLNAPLFPHPGSFLFLFSERFFFTVAFFRQLQA